MKRSLILTATVMTLVLSGTLLVDNVWARAGGGGSGGSRGSRSYTAPARPSPTPMSPRQPTPAPAPPSTFQTPPQRSGWGGMLGGLLVGGLIGSLLFGGMGRGLFGGIGLMEILIIGGLVFLALRFMKSRQPAPATPGYATAGGYGGASWQPESTSTMSVDIPVAPSDLDRGIGHIRQLDATFDPARFAETATDMFFKIQAAWTARDVSRIVDLLTPEMQDILQRDCDRLRADRRVNRLENIAVRQAEVSEAWQERGQDFATVYFLASLLDYTTDEGGTHVLDGSRDEPVKFEEYWTFVRSVGNNRWKLSAIQQPS